MNRTMYFVLAVGLFAGSCSSPTAPRTPGACGTNVSLDTMSARIDGQDWSSILTLPQLVGGAVSITGSDGCTPSRNVTFNLFVKGPGTYKIPETDPEKEFDEAALSAVLSIGNTSFWDAQVGHGSGTVTFTALNATGATGTFSFTLLPMVGTNATGTHTVTNGSFDVKFKVNQAGPLVPG